jgi:hypothetical protein
MHRAALANLLRAIACAGSARKHATQLARPDGRSEGGRGSLPSLAMMEAIEGEHSDRTRGEGR